MKHAAQIAIGLSLSLHASAQSYSIDYDPIKRSPHPPHIGASMEGQNTLGGPCVWSADGLRVRDPAPAMKRSPISRRQTETQVRLTFHYEAHQYLELPIKDGKSVRLRKSWFDVPDEEFNRRCGSGYVQAVEGILRMTTYAIVYFPSEAEAKRFNAAIDPADTRKPSAIIRTAAIASDTHVEKINESGERTLGAFGGEPVTSGRCATDPKCREDAGLCAGYGKTESCLNDLDRQDEWAMNEWLPRAGTNLNTVRVHVSPLPDIKTLKALGPLE